MKILLVTLFLLCVLSFSVNVTNADNDDCLCIASETVQKYCLKEREGLKVDEYRINQEAIAKRDIQKLINMSIEAGFAKDADAMAFIEADDLTVKELDGKVYTKEAAKQISSSANNFQGIIKISEDTKVDIECVTIKGKEAIVYINQHFVRYVPDRKDESPHEIITNIIHRETWIFTKQGWKVKYVEELERGNTYLDGKLFDIS